MNLSPVTEKFVLHWGEMGTRWGVSRTVAQIHALLYLSERALHAEEIAETLSVARSNVSTSVKELQGWGLVKVVHMMGDRRGSSSRSASAARSIRRWRCCGNASTRSTPGPARSHGARSAPPWSFWRC